MLRRKSCRLYLQRRWACVCWYVVYPRSRCGTHPRLSYCGNLRGKHAYLENTAIKIFRSQVWHYASTSQYDGKNVESGLFVQYVNTFLKLKQEADGYPAWCTDEALKTKYVREYELKEGKFHVWISIKHFLVFKKPKNLGIKLDPNAIESNVALRSLAKLMLNSHWLVFFYFKNSSHKNVPKYFYAGGNLARKRSVPPASFSLRKMWTNITLR